MTQQMQFLQLRLTIADMAFWGDCSVWMWRLSTNQNRLLRELHEQGKRIEGLSRAEHELIKDVHPKVGDIQTRVGEVMAAVKKPDH